MMFSMDEFISFIGYKYRKARITINMDLLYIHFVDYSSVLGLYK